MTLGRFDVWHVGMVVPDIRRSMEVIGVNLGLDWAPLQERDQTVRTGEGEVLTEHIQFTYSVQGVPHLELIESRQRIAWAPGPPGMVHHLGGFASLHADLPAMLASGYEVEFGGGGREAPAGFVYLKSPGGVRVELVDQARKTDFEAWFAGGDIHPVA